MSFFYKLFFTILFLPVLTFQVFSQTNQENLSGRISDANGAAVAGVRITARNKASGAEFVSRTDNAGNFRLENLPRGEYRVTAEAAGFSSASREISFSGSANQNVEINLSVGNISESVTVTVTRTELATTETAVPVSVLNREELERENLSTIGDVFRNLPGTSTTNEGGFQVRPRIRGLESNRVLILVDGERLNNARTSTGQSGIEIGLVEVEQIETLEVARGAGSVLYGTDALGGTINIITKEARFGRDEKFRFGGTFNGFFDSSEKGRRANLAITGSNRFFAFRVTQSLERFDNYFTGNNQNAAAFDGVASDGEVLNSQSHGGNMQATARFFLNENNNLKFNYERRRAANIGSPTLVGVFNAYFPFSDRDKISARYEGANFTENLARVSASLYYQRQKRNFTNVLNVPAAPPFFPGQYQFSETVTDTKSFGFDLQSNWIFGNKNLLTAGASFFRDANSDARYILRRSPNFATFPPTLVTSEDRSSSVPDANFGSFAVFAQNEFEATKKLKLVGGVRVDYFRSASKPTNGFTLPALTASQIEDLSLNGLTEGLNVSQTAVTGDFGAVYKLTGNVSLTGRIGRSYRVPNLFERFFTDAGSVGGFVVGNPNLKPESGVNIDVGAKFSASKFAGSFTYFNNSYRDFLSTALAFDRNNQPIRIIRAGGAPIDVYQTINIGKARIQGVEADGEYPIKLKFGFLTPGGNFSYLRGDDLGTGQPLNFISPFKTVLNLRWQDFQSRYFVEWTTRVVGKQERLSPAFFQTNGGAEPGFAVSDIRGGYNFRRERYRLSFNAGVTNLFNRYYFEQFVFAPAKGRSLVIGTTWEIF
ncbi:MAG TPA: TonB-dependent receptor [Pyrinomonadaceae bacterium]|jgi:hemoglobin/transferrin/lactoferrin receptor protein